MPHYQDHPLIKHFIKGVFHLRPPKPKYSSNLGCGYIQAKVLVRKIENNSQLNLLELSKKVTLLVLLQHGLRISTIAAFDVNLITVYVK